MTSRRGKAPIKQRSAPSICSATAPAPAGSDKARSTGDFCLVLSGALYRLLELVCHQGAFEPLPTGHSALRPGLEHGFETQGLRPGVIGAFEDDLGLMHGLRLLGSSDGVKQLIHAIRASRGQHHPLAMLVGAAARS